MKTTNYNINLSDLFKKKKDFKVPKDISPKKSWASVLIFSAVILAIGLAYDFYVYKIVSREPLYVEVPGEEMIIERLKVGKINNIVSFFETKKENNINLKKSSLIDPAL